VTAAQLGSMGLVATAPARAYQFRSTVVTRAWPSYERCLAGAPIGRTGGNPDSFRADYVWCLIAADWGHSVESIAARLQEVSAKAKQNGADYSRLTAERAAAAAASRPRAGPLPVR
jgi:hypothetical protein